MSLIEQLQGYRLTTAEILYHLPDHPHVLQTFVWQTLDLPPKYPRLSRFLTFWRRDIDGLLHSVRIVSAGGLAAGRTRHAGAEFRLH